MKICEITSEEYSAQINLSLGANCISLRNKTYHAKILREPDYHIPLDNPYLYGMPILFPVNRISGGKFIFENREYCFPVNELKTGCHLHGMLNQTEFHVIDQKKDWIICNYHASKTHPYLGYMHEFEIQMQYRVSEHGLEQNVQIKNESDQNMPIMIGFHTTFSLPFMQNQNFEEIRIYAAVSEEIERNMQNYLPTGNIDFSNEIMKQLQTGTLLPFKQKISSHYKSKNDGKMCIWDQKNKIGILYENSLNMKFRLIYNGSADEYICMEPQNCMVDCMNMKKMDEKYRGVSYVKPGETWNCWSKIRLIDQLPV